VDSVQSYPGNSRPHHAPNSTLAISGLPAFDTTSSGVPIHVTAVCNAIFTALRVHTCAVVEPPSTSAAAAPTEIALTLALYHTAVILPELMDSSHPEPRLGYLRFAPRL